MMQLHIYGNKKIANLLVLKNKQATAENHQDCYMIGSLNDGI